MWRVLFALDAEGRDHDGAPDAARMISPHSGTATVGESNGGFPVRRCALLLAVLLLVLLPGGAKSQEQGPQRVDFDFPPHGTIRWVRGQHPWLLVYPLRGDGWIALARRFTGSASGAKALQAANSGSRSPMQGRAVRVPLEVMYDDLRVEAVRRVFPADARVVGGWQHWVMDPFRGTEESWEWLAELFTGSSDHAPALQRANPGFAQSGPKRGRTLLVPESVLLAYFKAIPPIATPTPSPAPRVALRPTPPVLSSAPAELDYGRDSLGEYAVYRLQAGEALYSSVVVRFTGQLLAKQVNETAMVIAQRSEIEDVTEIPIGFPVKIPLDLLLPGFLPPDNPERLAWVAEQRELGRFLEVIDAANLAGVQVILDAGHGGRDSGAVAAGMWEATYAYDIMCRIKANLERHTRATVWTTVEHPKLGFRPPPKDRLPQTREAVVLTRPPYQITDTNLGVHLRWYLTNDIILNRLGAGFPRSKTVFLSVHMDSLHPSVRGAMIYVPSRYLRPDDPFTVKRKDIQKFAEYRNHPTIRLGPEFKAKVEASSRHLAGNILSSLKKNDIRVHPYEPVRDRIRRGRSSWVPAVLRFTAAQNAVLVEACNIANDEDRALMARAEWRESFARAVVQGMASAFTN